MSSEKKLKAKVLREMKPEERRELLNQLRAELVRLETQRARGFVEKPGRIRQVRRIIARILTIEREEELKKAKSRS
ncbi:50S ribosomal protein L29 [Pyrobaculum aerophilum]|uniref:Large ribosomal subunit protein uL29 n=2 Tax=Pyrobaculum aerophilum TaxID=13773 RepID=RL29_PYRAE|nr:MULTISPECIES: 50S ribosomal protein L29 [Pyrobaculum]Q8ZWI1.1 RecName: Full=Large ribosomal subunit protein uL29; AltName: Full=50S ribosomal protein L29 [Pyrobaculum aerophilum str. IM2]AAL63721.1 ribosomal protein L29 [Pyrobaculum aerophilum str. IM2]MCX8137374.1 50S ribosomal protein L29 [Pyrobaculum aerophilum]HII46331.1 50S ribosomal protein L29 [Pyrobaculum aerophilum]